jgi:Carboxypeptidase regulatory-like domain/TonB dependent receptor/TonB-dependent Receptor Plug Domain
VQRLLVVCLFAFLLSGVPLYGSVFGQLHGIVHDPQHRPIKGAAITLRAADSDFTQTAVTDQDGAFSMAAVPLGNYTLSASEAGFQTVVQKITLASGTAPVLHLELPLLSVQQSVVVSTQAEGVNVDSATTTTLITRKDVAMTPGANRTNSMAMITDYVPGAYMTHDMLHMRGGHQVSWQIDGVEIPNTNIGSNLGAQIDPKDIDYLEVQRGSYTADAGVRTYGVFNVVPRTGFERSRGAELIVSLGNYWQTNDQFNFGDHDEKLAYYVSLTGNRSDYGLSPPIAQTYHGATNGYGAFASFIYNKTPQDQLRLITQFRKDYFQIPYDPDPNSSGNQQFDSSGLRDGQHETDSVVAFSWLHTFSPSSLLQVSPFYHYNSANYKPNPNDYPVATTSDRASNYGGMQASISGQAKRNTLQGGIYAFGQHDSYKFGSVFNDKSYPDFLIKDAASGGVIEEYVSDNFKVLPWLTIIGGLRQSNFIGDITENTTSPRVGVAIQIPELSWVFRGFYGKFYQPPPLLTASGPLVDYANSQNTAFVPLHGEHDEEYQFGVQIPLRGWVLDADHFQTRVNNFLDHSNIGESSIYFPVTIDGALVQAWELTLQSPRLWKFGQMHLAYSNQIAKQRGAITGGLICVPVTSPQCDVEPGYTPVDHDQRNTLDIGFYATLPWRAYGSANVYYGSGFTNGNPNEQYPGDYLPQHTTVDLSLGKNIGERTTISVTGLNLANTRVLLDNSLTFGGFHYNDPREIYGEFRFRFNY